MLNNAERLGLLLWGEMPSVYVLTLNGLLSTDPGVLEIFIPIKLNRILQDN